MEFLVLSPDKELSFRRPLTVTAKQPLSVTNNLSEPIAFKIKTTAPKQYCVRPNSGRLEPGDSCTVSVLLQAMKEDPPSDFICKDKFLIQAIKVEKEVMSLDQEAANAKLLTLWSDAENSKKSGVIDALYEKKIKVVFVENSQPATGSDNNSMNTSTMPIPNDRPSSFMSINDDSLKSMINHKEKELADAQAKIKSLQANLDQAKLENDRLNQGLKLRKPMTDVAQDSSKLNQSRIQNNLKIVPSPLLESTIYVPVEWMVLLFVILSLLVVLMR